jgi:RNA-directed DNA polymerase
MSTVSQPMYGWNTFTWRETERRVFKLQKRIYQASLRGSFEMETSGKWIT